MNKPYVWIVDDDDIYQYTITKTLEIENVTHDVQVFSDGETALESLQELAGTGSGLPDFILLDLNMPIMDGWQFLDEYQNFPDIDTIKLFVVTSSVSEADQEKVKSYPSVQDYVVKPVDIKALKQLLAAS